MKPVNQTKLHDPENGINGNCLAASFASILEMSLSDIPEFENMGKEWWSELVLWVERLGFDLIQWREEVVLPGYYLVMGVSPRDENVNHQVVFKNGKMVHDPHPSRSGITRIKEVIALLPLDPSRFKNGNNATENQAS